jgi:hypothetical protein
MIAIEDRESGSRMIKKLNRQPVASVRDLYRQTTI